MEPNWQIGAEDAGQPSGVGTPDGQVRGRVVPVDACTGRRVRSIRGRARAAPMAFLETEGARGQLGSPRPQRNRSAADSYNRSPAEPAGGTTRGRARRAGKPLSRDNGDPADQVAYDNCAGREEADCSYWTETDPFHSHGGTNGMARGTAGRRSAGVPCASRRKKACTFSRAQSPFVVRDTRSLTTGGKHETQRAT